MIFLVKKVAELLINPAFPYKHNIGADYLGRALNILVFTDEGKGIHTQELFLFIDRVFIYFFRHQLQSAKYPELLKVLYFQKYIR